MNDFQEAKYIEDIRRRLWTGREFGQVAVMVGAGFSKNADCIAGATSSFPSWNDLALEIDRTLYSLSDAPNERRLRVAAKGATRLAGEYAVGFSRPSLDDLIARMIPDDHYVPGDLHRLLLLLPWSDIFTTNYDTLLERAQGGVFERKYDVVTTPADIVGRMKPRIVKLHGSLPSHRPFIITDEDFREYPVKFAPFVNMVQQSSMENALCLVGFSGSDPNFLRWIGWVRDNLGSATPPIYLVGLLTLSPPERRYLEQVLRIVPIDLSPLFDAYPSEIRHAAALEWFLASLRNGAPPNLLEWPAVTRLPAWRSSRQLPELVPPTRTFAELGPGAPRYDQPLREQVLETTSRWQRIRRDYPGWLVAPQRCRRTLWHYTERWVDAIVKTSTELPEPHDIESLYELNWRLERMLLPLFDDIVRAIDAVVRKYNPYPGLVKERSAQITSSDGEHAALDWQSLGERWVSLAFALLRAARERLDDAGFDKWREVIEPVAPLHPDWVAQLHYEECLFALAHLNVQALRADLERWGEPSSDPFWEVKRAALLAELGDLVAAKQLAGRALAAIRSRITPYLADYALLSREGWTMKLLQLVERGEFNAQRQYESEFEDRWSRLDAYRANPGPEIDYLGTRLERPEPEAEEDASWEVDRKTRRMKITQRFSSDLRFIETGVTVSDMIPAFAFLRLYEDAALPVRCGITTVYSSSVAPASDWVFALYPFLAIPALIRSSKPEHAASWFPAHRVAMLPQHLVDQLADLLLSVLANVVKTGDSSARAQPSDGQLPRQLMRVAPMLLGQLCFRLSDRQLDAAFDLCLELYHQPVVRHDSELPKVVAELFDRTLNALDDARLTRYIPVLLALPIPGNDGFTVDAPDVWPDVFGNSDAFNGRRLEAIMDRGTWAEPISHLLLAARSRNPEVRRRSVLRLGRLWDMRALTPAEGASFGAALWSQVDSVWDLPSNTDYLNFGLLTLPAPGGINVQGVVRRFLILSSITRTVQHSVDAEGRKQKSVGLGKTDHYLHELHGATARVTGQDSANKIRWSLEEAELLLRKIADWWDEEKAELDSSQGLDVVVHMVRSRFASVPLVLTDAIVPHLVGCLPETLALLDRLVAEFENNGFPTLPLRCSLLILEPERALSLAQRIRSELNAIDLEKIEAAARSITYWFAFHGAAWTVPPPPADLLDELIYRLRMRRQPGLREVIMHLKTIVNFASQLVTATQADAICEALDYLLTETALPAETMQKPREQINAPVPIAERPHYRALAAELAHSVFKAPFVGVTRTQVLQLWAEACRSDRFPEVRRAWRGQSAHAGAE